MMPSRKKKGIGEDSTDDTNRRYRGFPGGAVVKNPTANAGEMGSSPGPGRSHMPRNN